MPDGLQSSFTQPAANKTAAVPRTAAARETAARITGLYFGLGLLWISLTHLLLIWFSSQTMSGLVVISGQGTIFVFLSTPIVYGLVRRGFRELDRTNALLRAVTDGTTDAVFIKDREGRYLLFNRAAAGFVGKPVSEVLGRDDTALFAPESASLIMERDRQVMAAGQAETHEELLTAAGETRVYLATKAPYLDDSGNVVGLIGISRDITDRKRAESAIREQEIFARSVLDSISAHTAVLDADGVIIAVNESWRLFAENNPTSAGPAPRTGVGTSYLNVCDESAAGGCAEGESAATGIRRVLAGITDRFTLEYPCHSADEQRWFLMSVTRLDSGRSGVVVAHANITERKRDELQLRVQHALLSSQAEASPDGILVVDPENRVRSYNRRFLEIWGIPEELVAAGDDTAVLALARSRVADPEGFAARVAKLYATPDMRSHDEVELADGRMLDRYSGPVRGSDGERFGRVWFFRDITERRQAEEAHARLAAIVESSDDAICSMSLDGVILTWNAGAERMFNYTAVEVVGRPATILFPPDRLSEEEVILTRLRRGERVEHFDTVRSTKDGRRIDVSLTISPIRGTAGHVVGAAAIARDVTTKKRAEADQALLVAVVRSAGEAIVSADTDGVIRSWNPAAERLFGYSSDEAIGQSNFDLIVPFDRLAESQARVNQALRGERLSPLETVRLRKGGEAVHVSVSVSAIHRGGRAVGLSAIYQDITERKRAEEDRNRFVALADSSQEFIGMYDLDFKPFYINAAGLRLMGFENLDAACRVNVPDLFFPEDREFITGEFLPRVQRIGTANVEIRFRHFQSGEAIWMNYNVFTIRDPAGGVIGLATVSRNIHARKIAEQALRERERLLGIVTGSARVGLVVVSHQYKYLFANEAYAEIFGLDTADLVGYRVPDILAAGWTQIRPRLDQALAGERVEYELSLPAASGTGLSRTFRVMYEPRVWDTEKPTVVVVVMEITEQKRAEETVRESEQRYRSLVDMLPAAVFINSGGRISFCNPACLRLFGATESEQILGKTPFDLFHPDYHEVIRRRIADIEISGRAVPGIEVRARRLDGRPVPVYSVATPIVSARAPAILVALTDLTERERSMDLLRSVLGSVNDAILTIDERGTVLSANPATERSFGFSEADLVGRNVNALMPEPYRTEHDGYIANYLQTGLKKVIGLGREVEGRRRDGSTFPLELTVTEFRLDGRRHFTGVVRDITARKRLEAQFQQAQKMEAIGRLAGGVAHDFNNLLTIINGYSDLVLDALPADDPRRDFIAAIRESGDRAARLTQQLLAFSRKAIIEPKILDLNELVSESAKLLRRLIGEDISLAVLPARVPVRIKADPGQLEQVLMNLAVNARDAMPTGGRLTVETDEIAIENEDVPSATGVTPGRYARLRVADTGHGMSDEIQNKIFEPFFTTKGLGKGTGLGLAVVHGVVEQCGGHIEVASTVGAGTTFTLLLPIATEATTGPAAGTVRIVSRGTETILLVEDEDEVRTIARLALTMQGFTVLEAGRGIDALRLATEYPAPIHVLVTDVVMPEMGGRQLAEAVRNLRPEIRVLYTSGYTDDAVIHHGVQSTDAFVQKPFTPLGLARKVRAVLDGTP